MDRCRPRSRRRFAAAVVLVALAGAVAGCSANSSGSAGSTAASSGGSGAAPSNGSTSGPSAAADGTATLPTSTVAASTTTIVVDLGDLDKAAFCTVATSITDATGAFVAGATPDAVKTAFATMKSALATLSEKGAQDQRQQFAQAVTALGKADAVLAANGYDATKTQSELGTIDPDGTLIGAVTVVLTQHQAVCGP